VSMLNCPGWKVMGAPATGARNNVETSPVSSRRPTRRWGMGTMGPAAVPAVDSDEGERGLRSEAMCPVSTSVTTARTVQVEQPDPGGLQTLEEHGGHAGHQLVSEGVVGVGLGP
jgi:hypothetical protein